METQEGAEDGLMTHDEVLEKLGGCGRFTKLATFVVISSVVAGDIIVNNLAFYELLPSYECQ